jgi:hypothetical protein
MLHEPVEHRPAMMRDELCLLDRPEIDWRTARWKKWCSDDRSVFHRILFMGLLLFCSTCACIARRLKAWLINVWLINVKLEILLMNWSLINMKFGGRHSSVKSITING